MKKTIGMIAVLAVIGLFFAGCENDNVQSIRTFTVTFNAAGGSPTPATQTVEEGSFATVPNAPTRTGYGFVHWALQGQTTAFDFDTPITGNITLVAVWSATLLDAPSGVTATALSDSVIRVQWNTVPKATGFRVQRAETQGGTWTTVAGGTTAITTTSWEDTGLAAEITRWYRVIAVNAEGNSEPSQAVSATTLPPPHYIRAEGNTLVEQLSWLRQNAQNIGVYLVEIRSDEFISPAEAALPFGRADITVIMRVSGAIRRTINLSENGTMFTVPANVRLELEGNLTLMGRGANAFPSSASNNSMLIRVTSSSTLIMNDGVWITGNTNTAGGDARGGAVRVNLGGIFEMRGGEISANVTEAVINYGTFRINNGIIHGWFDATEHLRNSISLSNGTDGTAQFGTFDNNNDFTRAGDLFFTRATIHVENGMLLMREGGTLAQQLDRLRGLAQSGSTHIVEINANENISVAAASLIFTNRNDITITLRGYQEMRTANLSANGVMFTIPTSITLILDNNITLMGRGTNAVPSTANNNNHLVRVNDGGTLFMKGTARIAGNTNTSTTADNLGGAVRINSGGTFIMNGGEISNNTATTANNAGAVFIATGGIFTMNDGKISGNSATAANSAGGVFVATNNTFTMNGGEISGNSSTAANSVGAVRITADSTFTMNDGEISGNTAAALNGIGAVFITANGTFIMNDGEISDNTGGNGSAGIINTTNHGGTGGTGSVHIANGGLFEMYGGSILGNNGGVGGIGPGTGFYNFFHITSHSGFGGAGGVSVASGSVFNMHGGAISNNSGGIGGAGSGMHANGGSGGTGGVFVASSGVFNMRDGTIYGNIRGNGGAGYPGVSSPAIGANGPVGNGGVMNSGIFRISNGVIHGNDAPVELGNTGNFAVLRTTGTNAQHGTFTGTDFTSLGNLTNTNYTIHVINGVLQP